VPDRRLNFEQLRNQARDLLRQFRAADLEALARWDAHFARRPNRLQLAHAQAVLAREAGFPSWSQLKAYVEAPRLLRRPCGPKKLLSFSRLEELKKRHACSPNRISRRPSLLSATSVSSEAPQRHDV
jgi:hypothetical protein